MNSDAFIFIFLGLIVGGILGFTIIAFKRKLEKKNAFKRIANQKETFINNGEQIEFPNQDHSHQTKPTNLVMGLSPKTEEIADKTGDIPFSQKTITKEERKIYSKKQKLINTNGEIKK